MIMSLRSKEKLYININHGQKASIHLRVSNIWNSAKRDIITIIAAMWKCIGL